MSWSSTTTRQYVGRRAVGARDDEVVEFGVGDLDAALDQVVPGHDALGRAAEAHHRLHPCRRRRQRLARLGPPAAVVTRLLAARALGLAHRVEFLGRGVAVVGGAGRQHLRDHLLVPVHALHLVERPLVRVQTEPVHAVEDRLHRLRRGAGDVGVLDAQDEAPAVAAGEGPGEQRGARAADVKVAGRAGGEAGADGSGGHRGSVRAEIKA